MKIILLMLLIIVAYAAATGCARGEDRIVGGRRCENTCTEPNRVDICVSMVFLNEECGCNGDEDFVRDEKTQECVKLSECPKA